MSDFNAESYAAFWRTQNAVEKKRIEKRVHQAWKEARRLASCFVQKAGVEKVVLFGSMAEQTVQNEHFDIDLAIWGGDWYKAREIGENSAFKIDIVEYENLPPHLKNRIDRRGLILEHSDDG